MSPQTPQAGSNQTIQATDGTPLNPLAVNIAKAIRHTESGGDYNAVGDNGQSHGAYQFNKDNFKNWAKEYGLNPDDFSPTNQDKVAYARINSLLEKGRAPSEVAAIWNGAKYENGKYEAINPQYVERVKQSYGSIVGQPQGYQPPQPPGSGQSVSPPGVAGYAPPVQPQPTETQQSATAPIPTGSAGQSLGTPDPSKNPLTFGTKVANAIGLGGAADVFGTDIASLLHPKQIQTPSLKQNLGAIGKTAATAGALALAPETVGGAALAGAGVGAATQAGQAAIENKSSADIGKQGLIGGLIGGATGGALAGIGKLLGKFGDKIMNAEIKPSRADIKDGFSIDTIKKYDLGGTLGQVQQKTQSKLGELHNELTSKLANATERIDLAQVYDDAAKELANDKNLFRGFGSNTSLQGALNQLQNEVLRVNPEGTVSIPDAQLVKQGAGAMGAWQFGQRDPDSTAREAVYNVFYTKLKEAIEKASPEGVREINQAMSKLIPVQNAVLRRIPVAERNNPLSLTDFLGLLASASNPVALGPTLLNFLSKSGAVGNALSKKAGLVGTKTATPVAGIMASLLTPAKTSK